MPRLREDLSSFVVGLVDAREGADLPPGALTEANDLDVGLAGRGLMGRRDDEDVGAGVYPFALDAAVLNEPESVTAGHERPDAFACEPGTGLVALDLAAGTETDPLGTDGPEEAVTGAVLPSGVVASNGVGEDPWWVGYALATDRFAVDDPPHEREHHLVATEGFDRDELPTHAWEELGGAVLPLSPMLLREADAGTDYQLYVPENPYEPPFSRLFFRFSLLLHGGGETALSQNPLVVDVIERYDPSMTEGGPWEYDAGAGAEDFVIMNVYGAPDRKSIRYTFAPRIELVEAEVPARAYGVAIYVATATSIEADEPDGLYRLYREVPFSDADWTDDTFPVSGDPSVYHTFTVNVLEDDGEAVFVRVGEYEKLDVGAGDADPEGLGHVGLLDGVSADYAALAAGATYEERTGVAETTPYGVVRYGCACYHDGFLFVGDVDHAVPSWSETPGLGREPSALVRMLPYHGDAANWPEDAVGLPFQPVALASYAGRVWALGRDRVARVNPATLAAEEVVSGVGAFGPRSVCEGGGVLFVAGPRGAFLVAGTRVVPASGPLVPVLWDAFAAAVEGDPGATVSAGYEPLSGAFVVTRVNAAANAGETLVYRPASEDRPPMWAAWDLSDPAHHLLSWGGRPDDADAEAALYAFQTDGVKRVATSASRSSWAATTHRRACGAPPAGGIPAGRRRSYLRAVVRAVEGLALPNLGSQYALDGDALALVPAPDGASVDDLSSEANDVVYELAKGTRARTIRYRFVGTGAQGVGAVSTIFRPVGTA